MFRVEPVPSHIRWVMYTPFDQVSQALHGVLVQFSVSRVQNYIRGHENDVYRKKWRGACQGTA